MTGTSTGTSSATGGGTLGSAIPALLAERGVEVVFGIPGVHTVELYRGLAGSPLRHVTPRHEQGAGFMADGYARATGRVAACFVITGPGLLNIATAMAQAMADSVPMLVICTANPRATLGGREGRLHELHGQSAVGREVAAFARTLHTPGQIGPALDEAFATFACARPGPALIEIPLDLLAEPAPDPCPPAPPPAPSAPDPEALVRAARLLDAAARPAVLLGGGSVRAAGAVRRLVERIGAPVLATANARGILPAGHPLSAGGGLPLAPARALLRTADVVLALGTELGETDFEYAGEGPVEIAGCLIRVDIDAGQLRRNVPAGIAVLADAGRFAEALLPLLSAPRAMAEAAARVREDGRRASDPRLRRHAGLVEAIWRVLPDAIVAGDSTAASYAANLLAEPPAPRRWMSAATGFGTLGHALPAAIGARIGRPGAPVVCVIGDGGLHYTLPELAAAADAGAPVIVVLWNDRRYAEIERFMLAAGVAPVGVALHPTDFRAAATAFGAAHAAVATPAEYEATLVAAAAAPGVTILELDPGTFDWTACDG